MPVPVPPVSIAHPALCKCIKSGGSANPQLSTLHPLKRSFPPSPSGLPPSLGSHEQCITFLRSWRGTKTYICADDLSSCQVFSKGLAGAVDAPAIKGARVQTCIPPLSAFLSGCGLEMPPGSHPTYGQLTGLEPTRDTSNELATRLSPIQPELTGEDIPGVRAWPRVQDLYLEDDGSLFAPILEDDSPDMTNGDIGSSPIEPVTPFGDYVDRVVATSDATVFHNPLVPTRSQELQIPVSGDCDSQICHFHPYAHGETKDGMVGAVSESPSNTSLVHKRLAEPMAEWLVSYVWKVCTNVLILPQTIAPYTFPVAPQLRLPTPLYLGSRVHSLLMSTLLQPSAMLLALWYIVRLPVYFGAPCLGPEHVKERRFRVELLGDKHDEVDGESLEGTAAFRLIVLGCMLANKWLDDHTFSNKTWHTISGVPVQTLNKLEYFALDILSYDLSISPSAWSHWLNHLLSYHHSLTPAIHLQPIARPASNPNGLIRKTIQDIMEAPLGHPMNEPVFLGVEQRLKEKLGCSTVPFEPETIDIDLDEDGPLREEYLPKRRINNEGPSGGHSMELRSYTRNEGSVDHRLMSSSRGNIGLPPPAKWSPAGDEPLCRLNGRIGPMYAPVQPNFVPQYVSAVPAVWPTVGLPYVPFRHHSEVDYTSSLPVPQYTYWAPMSCSSAVQHSQPMQTPNYYVGQDHTRGYSVTGFEYGGHNIAGCRIQPSTSWTPLHQFGYATSRQSLVARPPPTNYQSTRLRV